MKQKHVIFLESNPSSGLEALQQANQILGHQTTFITSNLESYLRGRKLDDTPLRYATRILEVESTQTLSALKETLDLLNEIHPVEAVLTYSKSHAVIAAQVAMYFQLPHLSLDAARATRDKFLTRERLAKACIAQPEYRLVGSLEEVLAHLSNGASPLVLKPLQGSASFNTRVVLQESDVADLVGKETGTMLLEEFVSGPIVSVETITKNGRHHVIGVSDRLNAGFPFFVEVGCSFPSKHSANAEILSVALSALEALGVDFGPVRTKIVLSRLGPKVVEMTPSLAGGAVPQMMDLTRGGNILLDIVKLHLGELIRLDRPTDGVATSRDFLAVESGRLAQVEPSRRLGDPRVKKFLFTRRAGDQVIAARRAVDKLGYVITHDETEAQSEDLCRSILQETRFSYSR